MDVAYDHIQEENFPEDADKDKPAGSSSNTEGGLSAEFQEAFKAVSSSPWGAKLGGLWGGLKKQGETYYQSAQPTLNSVSTQARSGFSDIVKRTRTLSIGDALKLPKSPTHETQDQNDPSDSSPTAASEKTPRASISTEHPDKPESLPADILKEAQGMVSGFRSLAAKRLKDIEKAEDVADEALLRWGSTMKNWLAEAVTVTAPPENSAAAEKGQVLYESKDAEGTRVIHTTRLDAQLHVIHSSLDSFLKDPASPQYAQWKQDFDVEKQTQEIAKDLETYEELRRAMEKCVPEKTEYREFWCRYYFLRHVVESEEVRRKEMLKGASKEAEEETVGWGSDDSEEEDEEDGSDDDEDEEEEEEEDTDQSPTPNPPTKAATSAPAKAPTLPPIADAKKPAISSSLKPTSPRRSDDLVSRPDSDASYDLVSGATSRAPGTPTQEKKQAIEESDEEDWE